MIEAILKYNFMQNAILTALFASIACGIIGTIIVEKKLLMMSGGIAHTAFGGVGLGYFLRIEPLIGALSFSVFAAIIIASIHNRFKTNADILISMFWSLGMALGILFISFSPGYPPDITSYLFGDILMVSPFDLGLVIILDIIIIIMISAFFDQFKAYLFDEEFSEVIGIPTRFLHYMLFILIALTVVVLIRVVGIILIIALLSIPPSIARLFTFELKTTIQRAIIIGIVLCLSGLWVSFLLGISSGAAIIIISVLAYVLASMLNKISQLISYRR